MVQREVIRDVCNDIKHFTCVVQHGDIWVYMGDIWVVYGWHMDVYGWHIGGIWLTYGWYMGDIWVVYGWHIGGIWVTYGCIWVTYVWYMADIWVVLIIVSFNKNISSPDFQNPVSCSSCALSTSILYIICTAQQWSSIRILKSNLKTNITNYSKYFIKHNKN